MLATVLVVLLAPAGPRAMPDHYIFFGRDRERIHEPSFYNADGVAGAQLTYAWSELEPERDRYVFQAIVTDLAFLERHGKRLWIQLQDVSFDSAIINVPAYLRTDPAFHGGMARQSSARDDGSRVAEGWVARRWDPAVRARGVAVEGRRRCLRLRWHGLAGPIPPLSGNAGRASARLRDDRRKHAAEDH